MKTKLLLFLLAGFCAARAAAALDIAWQSGATNAYILNPMAISPAGDLAATLGTNNTIQIWRVSDGIALHSLAGNGLWVGDLAFSPDGAYLASGGGDSSVRVWRTDDWSLAYSLPVTSQGPPVAFSPDSATLAMGSGANVELRRATNGALIHSWTATSGTVAALAFSPEGTVLASGAGIRGADTALKLWQIPGGGLIRSIPTAQTYGIGRVAFSPDGIQVLTGSEHLYSGPMQSWRVSDGAPLRTFPEPAYAMAFSADGAVLAAVGTNITLFRAADGRLIEKYPDGFAGITPGEKGIALAPGGLFLRSRGHGEILAGRVPILVSAPVEENGLMIIRWVGGPGRYQLQRSLSLNNDWEDEGGILTSTSAFIAPTESGAFYRVVALPQ